MASVITICYYFHTNLKSQSDSDWYDKLLKSAVLPALRLTMFARAAVDVVSEVISVGLEAVELQVGIPEWIKMTLFRALLL